jgi:hypothetical protein
MALGTVRRNYNQQGKRFTLHFAVDDPDGLGGVVTVVNLNQVDRSHKFNGDGSTFWDLVKIKRAVMTLSWLPTVVDVTVEQQGAFLYYGPTKLPIGMGVTLNSRSAFDFTHLPEGGFVPSEGDETGNVLAEILGGGAVPYLAQDFVCMLDCELIKASG